MTEPAAGSNGWTLDTIKVLMDERESFRAELAEERDRRYAEVNVEKEKALKIKETADLAALQLAREIQTYKDEKANELREQINNERGLYATKDDLANVVREINATLKPLNEYVSSQVGRSNGMSTLYGWGIAAAGLLISTIIVINILVGK
jgi:hypothetical protein